MEALPGILLLVLLIRWAMIRTRFSNLEGKIEELEVALRQSDEQIVGLTRRIFELEHEHGRVAAKAPAVETPAAPPRPVAAPAPAPVPPAPEPHAPEPHAPAMPASPVVPAPPRVPEPPPPPPPPRVSMQERLQEHLSAEELETLIGGNWLNKVGMLILVVGIALFLGYSLTVLGPAGKVAVGYTVSLALLGGGIAIERKPPYRIFGRGLVAGGWSATYFTTYAMSALAAARVITSPLAGGVLLFAVAAAMIAHSLRYRSEAATGLTFFIGYFTLNIVEAGAFALAATVPLAVFLVVLANRNGWLRLAIFGLIASYGTYAMRHPLPDGWQLLSITVLWIYWALFEAYDILAIHAEKTLARSIFPLNACGFLGVALLAGSPFPTPRSLTWFLAAAAAAYLAGAVVRYRTAPRPAEDMLTVKPYELSVLLSAALVVIAVYRRFEGYQVNTGWLWAGESLVLAGILLRQSFLRYLGAWVLLLPAAKVLGFDTVRNDTVKLLGLTPHSWSPVALLTALVAAINRRIARPEQYYSFAATILVATVIGVELPPRYIGIGWLLLAALLFEIRLFTNLPEFRWQAYPLGALAILAAFWVKVLGLGINVAEHPWRTLGVAAVLTYAGTVRVLRLAPGRLGGSERALLIDTVSTAGGVFAAALAAYTLPVAWVGGVWLAIAWLLFEISLRSELSAARRQAFLLGPLGIATSLGAVLFGFTGKSGPDLGVPLLVAAAAVVRVRGLADDRHRLKLVNVLSGSGTLLAALLAWYTLPSTLIAPAWAALALVLFELAPAADIPYLRLLANVMSVAVFVRLFLSNFLIAGSTAGVSHRILTVAPVAAMFYYFASRSERTRAFAFYLWAAAVLAFALIRFEAGHTAAVAGWGLFAFALALAGARVDERHLRYQACLIAAAAFARSWATNFYIPGSFAGVPERVLTGAGVVAALYGAQLVSARSVTNPGGGVLGAADRHARAYFSLLATTLLAVLLCYEVSGQLLTVALGLEGIALLILGFPLRERVFRLSGMLLFLLCVLKVFFYDLRTLDTMGRILSFIVLGLLMVAGSWLYTRFREQVKKLL